MELFDNSDELAIGIHLHQRLFFTPPQKTLTQANYQHQMEVNQFNLEHPDQENITETEIFLNNLNEPVSHKSDPQKLFQTIFAFSNPFGSPPFEGCHEVKNFIKKYPKTFIRNVLSNKVNPQLRCARFKNLVEDMINILAPKNHTLVYYVLKFHPENDQIHLVRLVKNGDILKEFKRRSPTGAELLKNHLFIR